jgi:ubiquinone/menaquinone biosynthesis C-methylase UbiE
MDLSRLKTRRKVLVAGLFFGSFTAAIIGMGQISYPNRRPTLNTFMSPSTHHPSPPKSSWITFWNQSNSIYANERHLEAHYRLVAECIVSQIKQDGSVVLDYGCGDALSADQVAAHCKQLFLLDAAEQKRQQLQDRFRGLVNLEVLGLDDLGKIAPYSLDLVVINSVAQYLSRPVFLDVLKRLQSLLKPGARVVVADIIQPGASMLSDVSALLRFAMAEGFLVAALSGLVRTLFSEYTVMRKNLGLQFYTEAELLELSSEAGYNAVRLHSNFGHNQSRMAFQLMPPSQPR